MSRTVGTTRVVDCAEDDQRSHRFDTHSPDAWGCIGLETKNTIDLQSVVDTHEQPFVIIDRDFTIVAVNRAYEQAYGSTRENMIGQHCYQVSHQNDKPCFELGEDCPHQTVYQTGKSCSCMHIHYDPDGCAHQVRINAYPLMDSAGELYLGEAIQDLSEPGERSSDRIRMVGQSPIFLRMLEQLKLAAAADAPILLQGETGTGKDLAANFIHQHSSRCNKPFLTLDCTVLTESLFEAEVFGHERGAFTGSVGEKEGLFEVVNGGTLFLDEIGEMPAQLQAKLLRVLETGEYRRVGGRKTLHTNARIICATNRNLGSDIESKDLSRRPLLPRCLPAYPGAKSARTPAGCTVTGGNLARGYQSINRQTLPAQREFTDGAADLSLPRQYSRVA